MRPRLATIVTGLVLLALYAPIVLVAANSLNADDRLASWAGATSRWWVEMAGDPRVRTDLGTSLLVGVGTTCLSVTLALLEALWWRGASRRGRRLLEASTFARIILPEVVLALALFLAAQQLGLPLGVGAIMVGQAVFCSAYATIVLQARLQTIGTSLEEAAADLGAPPHRVFGRVTLPLLASAILAASLLVLSFSFDDVVVAQFLGGTQAETLPVLLLGKIRLTVSPQVNAIGTALMLTTALPVVAGLLLGRLPVPGSRPVGARR
ncbi:ABC transporter permease [Kribbella sp. NPDC056861]|uniref:ABC transporter permease n=1 Tax=Kribbella sp. NPDC056861 TaxID=3154857 RepID=UPI00341F718B